MARLAIPCSSGAKGCHPLSLQMSVQRLVAAPEDPPRQRQRRRRPRASHEQRQPCSRASGPRTSVSSPPPKHLQSHAWRGRAVCPNTCLSRLLLRPLERDPAAKESTPILSLLLPRCMMLVQTACLPNLRIACIGLFHWRLRYTFGLRQRRPLALQNRAPTSSHGCPRSPLVVRRAWFAGSVRHVFSHVTHNVKVYACCAGTRRRQQ